VTEATTPRVVMPQCKRVYFKPDFLVLPDRGAKDVNNRDASSKVLIDRWSLWAGGQPAACYALMALCKLQRPFLAVS
jgi:hypothetical protein